MARGNPLEMRHTLKTEWIFGVVGGVLAAGALGLGRAFGKIEHSSLHQKLIGWAAALVLIISGAFAIVHLSRAIGRTVARQSNIGAGASIRLVASGLGFLVLIFGLLTVLGVSLDHLLIGAGVAGIILGVAAQQSLGNVFAAIVMLFARPFVVGDRIRIRSGVTGVIDVRVLGIGLTYVTVMTEDGILKVPNSILLGSGIGQLSPGAPPTTVPVVPPTAPTATPAPASGDASLSAGTSSSAAPPAGDQIEEETP
jgi:small-conductance mechanosensitive channel